MQHKKVDVPLFLCIFSQDSSDVFSILPGPVTPAEFTKISIFLNLTKVVLTRFLTLSSSVKSHEIANILLLFLNFFIAEWTF